MAKDEEQPKRVAKWSAELEKRRRECAPWGKIRYAERLKQKMLAAAEEGKEGESNYSRYLGFLQRLFECGMDFFFKPCVDPTTTEEGRVHIIIRGRTA